MHPVFAANLLAEVLQLGLGILLGLPASRMAGRRQWWVSALAAPAALVVLMNVGGLVLAIPAALVVTGCYHALAALRGRGRRQRWARGLHLVMGAAIVLWLIAQVVHLPIRVHLQQDVARIAGNVAGIAVGLALAAAFVESRARCPAEPGDAAGRP